MNNMLKLLALTTAVGLAAPLYAAESTQNKANVEFKKDGGYVEKRSSETIAPDGTKKSAETKVDVDVKSDGKVNKTVSSEATTDPKGLMNKKTNDEKTEFEEKARGGYKQTTTRSHIDADGTKVTFKSVTDVDVDSSGNVTTTAKTEKTVDPKGLFNEQSTKSTTKSVNGNVTEQNKKIQ